PKRYAEYVFLLLCECISCLFFTLLQKNKNFPLNSLLDPSLLLELYTFLFHRWYRNQNLHSLVHLSLLKAPNGWFYEDPVDFLPLLLPHHRSLDCKTPG